MKKVSTVVRTVVVALSVLLPTLASAEQKMMDPSMDAQSPTMKKEMAAPLETKKDTMRKKTMEKGRTDMDKQEMNKDMATPMDAKKGM